VIVSFLGIIAYAIGLGHFIVPLSYYGYLRRYRDKSWAIIVDYKFRPKIAVILPTYNESDVIERRLDNLRQQTYPRELTKVIVVDSSNDGTAELVENFAISDVSVELIRESKRTGKLKAIFLALDYVPQDTGAVVLTDADAVWEPDALEKAMRYLSDPEVACVTSGITYLQPEHDVLEHIYRDYYNTVRCCESKIHSTPIQNGPFVAIKAEVLRRVGLPSFTGSDDSIFGSLFALAGYRAIQVDDIIVREPVRTQSARMIRRAQTLLFNFLLTKRYAKKMGTYRKSSFEKVWRIEWWLNIANPWLLLTSATLIVADIAFGSILSLGILIVALALLFLKTARMWVLHQLYVVLATIRSARARAVVWEERNRR
jgi:cellulose synthase/poly-beta-1,6-N-acetylglucosamine synthase-like glycosyltransferase